MLIDYASGALREAASLAVATHLALCPSCRQDCHQCEEIGGTLLEQDGGIPVSSSCKDKVMAALDAQLSPPRMPAYDPFLCRILPAPLRSYVGCGASEIRWQRCSDSLDRLDLTSCQCKSGQALLVRIRAGAEAALPVPATSLQSLLVLAGSLAMHGQTYTRGDFIAPEPAPGQVKAEGEADCICLLIEAG